MTATLAPMPSTVTVRWPAQVLDVDAARLGDPQPEQPEQAGDGVVDRPRRCGLGHEAPSSMRSSPSVADSVDLGPADVFGRRLGHVAIDDGEAVEPDHRGQAAADRGPGQVPVLLHPPGVELDVDSEHGQGLEADLGAPGEPGLQVAGVSGAALPEY